MRCTDYFRWSAIRPILPCSCPKIRRAATPARWRCRATAPSRQRRRCGWRGRPPCCGSGRARSGESSGRPGSCGARRWRCRVLRQWSGRTGSGWWAGEAADTAWSPLGTRIRSYPLSPSCKPAPQTSDSTTARCATGLARTGNWWSWSRLVSSENNSSNATEM